MTVQCFGGSILDSQQSQSEDLIEDVLMSFLEKETCRLPQAFTVVVPDEQLRWLIENDCPPRHYKLVTCVQLMRITLDINGFSVTIRSEKDPDDWLPMTRSEAWH